MGDSQTEILHMTTDIVSSYISGNQVPPGDLAPLIAEVHTTLANLAFNGPLPQTTLEPAVHPSRSISPEYLICLEDGKKLKMLKRYLRTRYGLSPEDYRERWRLPPDYPMVAPNYAKRRSEFAKEIGLGRSRKT